MRNITILSEDQIFSRLLARNLEALGYTTTVISLGPEVLRSPSGDVDGVNGASVDLWILDMTWFDEKRQSWYAALAEWCRSFSSPFLLIVDASWAAKDVQGFQATANLVKPFPMSCLLAMVAT